MNNDNLKNIYEQIIKDPLNESLINKGFLPLYKADSNSKILIIGQAPGIKAQESMTLFNDKSGDTLREWLNVSKDEFYDSNNFSILPMDFFYPGKAKTGDKPPRIDFAEKWHPLIINELKNVKLIILTGSYAVNYYLKDTKHKTLTETVKNYKKYLPNYFPTVHPSPLNFRFHNKNPWFKQIVVKDLKNLVRNILNND